ncbi:MAG TPA: hypothetical protein VE596_12885 [Gaiellaceae bacterium]|nr:hypothetical protein [Gaiellaceae bacterium]
MRRTFLIVLAAIASSAIALLLPGRAAACSQSSHCHAEADFFPVGTYTGGFVNITTTRLTNNATPSDIVTSELWIIDERLTPKFVEEGAITGRNGSRRWFWADQCSPSSYSFHDTSLGFALGTQYGTKISYNGGGKWAVYRNGGFVNNSATCHGSTAQEMQAGGESTSNANVLTGDGNNLQKRGSDNVSWSYNWGGADVFGNAPMTASWVSGQQYAHLTYGEN